MRLRGTEKVWDREGEMNGVREMRKQIRIFESVKLKGSPNIRRRKTFGCRLLWHISETQFTWMLHVAGSLIFIINYVRTDTELIQSHTHKHPSSHHMRSYMKIENDTNTNAHTCTRVFGGYCWSNAHHFRPNNRESVYCVNPHKILRKGTHALYCEIYGTVVIFKASRIWLARVKQ